MKVITLMGNAIRDVVDPAELINYGLTVTKAHF